MALCEHYDILDKIVPHDDHRGWPLRLHVFFPDYFDRPHNHRWTYSSHILRGSYPHTRYGTEDQLGNEDIDVTASPAVKDRFLVTDLVVQPVSPPWYLLSARVGRRVQPGRRNVSIRRSTNPTG